jgi:mannosyltransferase OCH1-like enzyme
MLEILFANRNTVFIVKFVVITKVNTMIQRRIFYVWLGGEKTKLAQVCIESWHQSLHDYDFIEINESSTKYFNFSVEQSESIWFKTLCDLKIWALAAEYIRCKVLYIHGGIYLDSDVSLYKDITPFLKHKLFLYGSPATDKIDAAVVGAEKEHQVFGEMLKFYEKDIWTQPVYILPDIITGVIAKLYELSPSRNDIVENDEVTIYPYRYFCPHYYSQTFSHDLMTPETHSVHWHAGSWMNRRALYFLSKKHQIPLKTLLRQIKFIEKVDKDASLQLSMDKLQSAGRKDNV